MSRYSPTVLPEANYGFANFLGGLASGADFGAGLAERRRKSKQDQAEFTTRQRGEQLSEAIARKGAREQGIVPTPKIAPGVRTNIKTLGQTGYAYDPTVTERSRKSQLSDYLARMIPAYEARSQFDLAAHPERGAAVNRGAATEKAQGAKTKDTATSAAAIRTQFGQEHPELMTMGDADAVRFGKVYATRADVVAHPAPARAATRGGPSPQDRRTGQLQRDLTTAQGRVQALERAPEYAQWRSSEARRQSGQPAPKGSSSATYDQWLTQYQAALRHLQGSQAAVDSALHPSPRGRRPPPARHSPLPALPPLPS